MMLGRRRHERRSPATWFCAFSQAMARPVPGRSSAWRRLVGSRCRIVSPQAEAFGPTRQRGSRSRLARSRACPGRIGQRRRCCATAIEPRACAAAVPARRQRHLARWHAPARSSECAASSCCGRSARSISIAPRACIARRSQPWASVPGRGGTWPGWPHPASAACFAVDGEVAACLVADDRRRGGACWPLAVRCRRHGTRCAGAARMRSSSGCASAAARNAFPRGRVPTIRRPLCFMHGGFSSEVGPAPATRRHAVCRRARFPASRFSSTADSHDMVIAVGVDPKMMCPSSRAARGTLRNGSSPRNGPWSTWRPLVRA